MGQEQYDAREEQLARQQAPASVHDEDPREGTVPARSMKREKTMRYFADHAIQSTQGDRGTTTRRKSTITVRGPEGAYCAQMREVFAKSRPAKPKAQPLPLGLIHSLFLVTCRHPSGESIREEGVNLFWETRESDARARAFALNGRIKRKDTIREIPPGKRKPVERTRWTEVAI